ncbi:PREDICTED: embryonic growth/differentiation factor 1 isoform X1 [Calidris pugnax]|uniref:embryonic growth/differentiation factor 1 isoform X1 n=1 Tax=Calidris pugnax TaxID=198806 RepID=UPI00071E24F0|nr:PREDICTED: embryonic growth/differentiation factor 1 isoform X1 [Calidris pugnax]
MLNRGGTGITGASRCPRMEPRLVFVPLHLSGGRAIGLMDPAVPLSPPSSQGLRGAGLPTSLSPIFLSPCSQELKRELREADPTPDPGPTVATSVSPPLSGHFIHNGQPPRLLCLQKRLYFNLSALEEGERLTMAQLEIKFSHNSYHASSRGQVFELRLYQAPQMSLRGMPSQGRDPKLLVERSFAQLRKSLLFNLSGVAKDWRTYSRNLGLILEISVSGGEGASTPTSRGLRSLCASIDSFLDTSLLVVTLSQQQCEASRRRRRRSLHHPPLMPSNLCKPRQLYISFSEVGWENWIIAPQGYMANYCLGECPFPLTAELNSTNHAILQTMVHSLDPQGTPQPCCVPVRLSPISILYYDNSDNVVLRHYEDMVVDECGCR